MPVVDPDETMLSDESFHLIPLYIEVSIVLKAPDSQCPEISRLIIRQIEGTQFCIDRQVLVSDSEFFRELFELPPGPNKPADGSCANRPLRIEGVRESAMSLLLRVLYPRWV